MNPATANATNVLEALHWRYATKIFDPQRKISAEAWEALEEVLLLTPSSYGLQPWKFIVVTDPTLKVRLRAASWNQSQVEDCSHHVVFLAKETITVADVDRFLERIAEVRGVPVESLNGYRDFMMGDLIKGPRAAFVDQWAARQVYIALGNFMTAAAMMGIDACPMEGLDPNQYDEILGIKGSGYRTVCACPAGFRAQDDKYATLAKVRFPAASVIEHR